MVVFENAAHGIYDEEPDKFFAVLKDFIIRLPEVSEIEVSVYKASLRFWKQEKTASPDQILGSYGWGWSSSQKITERYSRDWLEKFKQIRSFMRLGFALYDVEKYEEALFFFFFYLFFLA